MMDARRPVRRGHLLGGETPQRVGAIVGAFNHVAVALETAHVGTDTMPCDASARLRAEYLVDVDGNAAIDD